MYRGLAPACGTPHAGAWHRTFHRRSLRKERRRYGARHRHAEYRTPEPGTYRMPEPVTYRPFDVLELPCPTPVISSASAPASYTLRIASIIARESTDTARFDVSS
jgi:hypothetical protein